MTQDQAPQFHLPQRPVPRAAGSTAGKLACVLLVIVVALQIYGLVRSGSTARQATAEPAGRTAAVDLKAVAMKLEDRNLPAAAADAWRQYLAATALEPLDQARIRYRLGKLQFQGEQYQQAVADLYLAEQLVGDRDDDLARRIAMQVRECLQKMGRYAELTREMAARATPDADADSPPTAHQVVAEIGDEKITVADFDRMLRSRLDNSVNAQVGLSPAQADEFRKQMTRELSDPQAKARFLHQMVAGRVLASEAKRAGLDRSPDYRQSLMAFADELLASKLMAEEIAKRATVTPQDAQRFYETEKDRYAEPAKVTLAHVLCASHEMAQEVLEKARAGEDFAALVEQYSADDRTKPSGGRITQPVTRDADVIPGIGRHPDLQGAIWAVDADSVLNEVYQSDAGWHVVKVLDRTERVERSYEEVEDLAERDAREARRREVTQQYLQELFERHDVKLYPDAFLMTSREGGATSEP